MLRLVNNKKTHLLRNTNYYIPHYAIFAGFILFRTCWAQIFSSGPCSRKFTLYFSCGDFDILAALCGRMTLSSPRAQKIGLHVSFAPARSQFFKVLF